MTEDIKTLAAELNDLLADHNPFHSRFQIDHLITQKAGLTAWGMYRQALRELSARYYGLHQNCLDLKLIEVDIEELECALQDYEGDRDPSIPLRRAELHLAKKRLEHEQRSRTAKAAEVEFWRFFAQARALRAKLGDLTPTRVAELEDDYWRAHFTRRIGLDIATTGRVRANTRDAILSLPETMKSEFLKALDDPGCFVQATEVPSLVDVEAIADEAQKTLPNGLVRRLIEECCP